MIHEKNTFQAFPQGSSLFPAVRPLTNSFPGTTTHPETSAFSAEQVSSFLSILIA
uniref:Uncharacterized protein n=1 Tax=Parascaris equorum TaxID=6256 RepID=A0A914RJG6_PAREQ